MTDLKFFVVSDAVGETALRVTNAVYAQFPTIKNRNIKRYPFIDSKEEIISILHDAKLENAIVIATIVNSELAKYAQDYAEQNNVRYENVLSNLLHLVKEQTNIEPIEETGLLQQLDQNYFDRVSAIEFAVKYDDGKNNKGYALADMVLLGVSRTSKTPLSMYLANKGYKVANLPLIPEVPIPKEIYEIDNNRIFGLIASPRYIMNIRSERVKILGIGDNARYNSIERVKEELMFSENLFMDLGARMVNVENKSIEETAAEIEAKYKQNGF